MRGQRRDIEKLVSDPKVGRWSEVQDKIPAFNRNLPPVHCRSVFCPYCGGESRAERRKHLLYSSTTEFRHPEMEIPIRRRESSTDSDRERQGHPLSYAPYLPSRVRTKRPVEGTE